MKTIPKMSGGASSRPRARAAALALPVPEPPPKLILVVEDDATWRGIFLDYLAEFRLIEVTAPTSHEETASALSERQYDALLVDGLLWDDRSYNDTHGPAIQAQVRGGARLLAVSSNEEACKEMAEYCTGTRQPASAWSKGRILRTSLTERHRDLFL